MRQEEFGGLNGGPGEYQADLGGEVVGVKAKVDEIAMQVDGVGGKLHGLGSKLDKLQAAVVAVKADVEGVADANEAVKSSMRKMRSSISGIGEHVERALNSSEAGWYGPKKRRLDNSDSGGADDDDNGSTGAGYRRPSEPAAQVSSGHGDGMGVDSRRDERASEIGRNDNEARKERPRRSLCLTQSAYLTFPMNSLDDALLSSDRALHNPRQQRIMQLQMRAVNSILSIGPCPSIRRLIQVTKLLGPRVALCEFGDEAKWCGANSALAMIHG